MLLAIDAGNSNILVGVFKDDRIVHDWRLLTEAQKTVDEYGILFQNLSRSADLAVEETEAIIISCVIPPLLGTLEGISRKYFHLDPLIVDPGVKGSAIVDAKISISDFNAQFRSSIPEDPAYETLAGYLHAVTGGYPEINEELKAGGFEFKVLSKTRRRIRQLRVRLLKAEHPESEHHS